MKKGILQPTEEDLPEYKFKVDTHGRRFHTTWYWKELPGNKKIKRDWLSYSITNDKLYCIHCILFGKNSQKAWTKNGFSTWSRAVLSIQLHECSDTHIDATLKFKLRQTSLPILPLLREKENYVKVENREIVKCLINITLALAKNCLAFRGHCENINDLDKNNGNFINFAKVMAKYSPYLASYISKLESSKKPELNFLSKFRQNQLISCCASYVKDTIKTEIRESRFFSVSMDSTFDLSRKEQISFIVRYINSNGKICERLLALKDSAITTSIQMFNVFENICNELSLDWTHFMVGQSYDGAQNMRGQQGGLQALIKKKCPTATFIWCSAHRLNLVVTKTVSCSLDAVDLFGNIETIYNFICNSKKRVAYYEEKQKEHLEGKRVRRLKRVATTRWSSQDCALQAILHTFNSVVDTLEYTRNTEGREDHGVGHMAGCLMDYLLSRRFVMTAVWFQKIFNVLSPLSTILQSCDLDLLAGVNAINDAHKCIQRLRKSESLIECLIKEVDSFIKEKDNFEFSDFKTIRQRRKKKMPGEEYIDEPIIDPIQKFKVETIFGSIDNILNNLDQYFNDNAVGIMKDLAFFSVKRIDEIKKNPKCLPINSFVAFCDVYGTFVNQEELKSEYLKFCNIYKQFESTTNLPEKFYSISSESENISSESEEKDYEENVILPMRKSINPINFGSLKTIFKVFQNGSLGTIFPSLDAALKISLTIPLSSASTERSFSKLKIIKSRLRTTMSQHRLEELMIISCERDISDVIDEEEVLRKFAANSNVLLKHLM